MFSGPSALCWLKGGTANPGGCVAGLNVTEAHLSNLVKVSGLSSTHPVFNMGQTVKKKFVYKANPYQPLHNKDAFLACLCRGACNYLEMYHVILLLLTRTTT